MNAATLRSTRNLVGGGSCRSTVHTPFVVRTSTSRSSSGVASPGALALYHASLDLSSLYVLIHMKAVEQDRRHEAKKTKIPETPLFL